jgi:hypothetical protein
VRRLSENPWPLPLTHVSQALLSSARTPTSSEQKPTMRVRLEDVPGCFRSRDRDSHSRSGAAAVTSTRRGRHSSPAIDALQTSDRPPSYLESDAVPSSFRRTDIQGLRGVAVLLVVLYHGGFDVPGGFTGVDVFFVISGFVIAGLLLREFDGSGSIRLTHFYARRIRRLLPALAVMVALVAVAGVLASPVDGQVIGAHTGSQHLSSPQMHISTALALVTPTSRRRTTSFFTPGHLASRGSSTSSSQHYFSCPGRLRRYLGRLSWSDRGHRWDGHPGTDIGAWVTHGAVR